MIRELTKNNDEFSKNTGEILTAHYVDYVDLEKKEVIDKILDNYDELYNLNDKTFTTSKKTKSKTKFQNKYPYWLHLLEISRKVHYNQIEEEIKIENILEQSNLDFLKSIITTSKSKILNIFLL